WLEEYGFAVRAEHVLERAADLIKRAIRSCAIEDERHDVLGAGRGVPERVQVAFALRAVARLPQAGEIRRLLAGGGLVHLEQRNRQLVVVRREFIDAHDQAAALFDLPLLAGRTLRNLALEPSRLESAHDAADLLDLPEEGLGLVLEILRELLDVVRPAQRIDDVRHATLESEDLLGSQR